MSNYIRFHLYPSKNAARRRGYDKGQNSLAREQIWGHREAREGRSPRGSPENLKRLVVSRPRLGSEGGGEGEPLWAWPQVSCTAEASVRSSS